MIRFFYNLLFPIGLVFFLPGYVVKMLRRGNYRHKFAQRIGFYDRETRARLRSHPRTWIHAVSVGEVAIALKLAAKLRELDPAFHCALTTTTTTGFSVASAANEKFIEVMYNPLDWWPIMLRAMRTIRPVRVVLVEAEVWPNMVAVTKARGVSIALVNARLSRRSEARFRRFRAIVAPIFQQLDLVCVQEHRDLERWSALGIPRERIHHVGSVKFDVAENSTSAQNASMLLNAVSVDAQRPVLLGGSTHEGEEAMLARAFLELRREFPQLLLVIAPRHVERAAGIRDQLEALGLSIRTRTEPPRQQRSVDCLLLNTTGELRDWYAAATVVFIGKSMSTRGGQNPVEPIVAGKPVVFGPHMENFDAIANALVRSGGAIQVRDEAALVEAAVHLFRDAGARERMVANALTVLAEHRGATARTAALLLRLPVAHDGKPLAT